MTYRVTTAYPKSEEAESSTRYVATTRKVHLSKQEFGDVVELHAQYLRQGFIINTTFMTNSEEVEQKSPFEIAAELEQKGVDYKATLKIKNSGSYDEAKQIAHIIEQQGYDYNVDAKLKINEESPVDFDRESTWMSDDAIYKVTPKASEKDIVQLRPLWDALSGYDVTIDIKPKKSNDNSDDDFATQLMAYPDGTEVVFTLKDGE